MRKFMETYFGHSGTSVVAMLWVIVALSWVFWIFRCSF